MTEQNQPLNMNIPVTHGLLTSLRMPRSKSVGCFIFVATLLIFSLFAVVFIAVIITLNANKLFENIGKYSLQPTMEMIENNVPKNIQTDFSNAYLNVFTATNKNVLLNPKPWKVKALNYVASAVKDRKLSRSECENFIDIVNSSTTNKYE